MRKATTLLLLALSLAFLTKYHLESSHGAKYSHADSVVSDIQNTPATAKVESGARGTMQAVAAAHKRTEILGAPEVAVHGHSRANTRAATIHSALPSAEFWQQADRNRESMYAVLWQILENGKEDELRKFILETLDGRFNDTPGEMFSVLVRTAPTPALRKEILRLLAEASQELSVTTLSQALRDADPAVRQSASASLNGLGANALLDAMTDAVLDDDYSVRMTAFQTLEDMHGFVAIWNVAERVLDDPDPRIRKRALELVFYAGFENAFDHLVQALRDPDPQVSDLAVALLAEYEEGST